MNTCKHIKAVRLMLVLAIFPLIFIIGLTASTYNDIEEIRMHKIYDIQQFEDRKWDMIENIIEENEQKAKINANGVKQKITSDLLVAYSGRLLELHQDLLVKGDSLAYKIMNDDIKDVYLNAQNENNRVYVANRTGILADRGYRSSEKSSRDWDVEVKSKLNSELASKAVSMILTKDNEMIYWKPDTAKEDNNSNTDPSMAALKSVYRNYGIDGLKNYDILVPVYITNDGDIFGIADVDLHGKKVDNDKIIVIQEFSIYDAVMLHKDDIERYDAYAKDCEQTTGIVIRNKMIGFCFLVLLAFGSLIATIQGANLFIKWGGDGARTVTNREDNNC